MNKNYNILWFDDEHENLKGFKMQAVQNDIKLIPFKSAEEGLDELKRNYPSYDGVLMDARFFLNKEDSAGSEDLSALMKTKEELISLRDKKKFEVFVLTGQAELFEDKTFKTFFPKYYRKGVAEDVERLLLEIKEAAKNQGDTKIRHKYQRVFDVCNEKYIGELAGTELLGLLRSQDDYDLKKYLNPIRKIVEDVFLGLNKFDLLPKEFVTPNISINETSKFLTGNKEKGFTLNEVAKLPKMISQNLRNILWFTQAGSHRSFIDGEVNELGTTYLLNSITYQLLDVIVWFKVYVDSVPKTQNWVSDSTSTNVVSSNENSFGEVINKNDLKGFAFLKMDNGRENVFIPPHLVDSCNLVNGDQISIEIDEYLDKHTGETKFRAKKIN
jgi:cold shock CspA family protein